MLLIFPSIALRGFGSSLLGHRNGGIVHRMLLDQ